MEKKAADLLEQAIRAGVKRDYKTSISILEDLLARGFAAGKQNPYHAAESHPEILLYLSRAWNAEHNAPRAMSYARLYTTRRPDDAQGWFFLGRAFFRGEQFDKAAAALERSMALNADFAPTHTFLGFAYLKAKRVQPAKNIFEQAVQRFPENRRLKTGYLNTLFIDAVQHFRKGDADMARQMFTFVINNGIDGVAPRLYLAHSLRSLGFLPEALSQYNAAIQFEPKDLALKWYAAGMMQLMGNVQDAAALLAESGVSLNNTVSDEFLAFGAIKTHFERENWQGVIQAARIYIKHYGASVQAHLFIAEAQRNIGRTASALNHYRRALDIEPDNEHAYYGLADALEKSHRWQELEPLIARIEKAACWDDDTLYYHKVLIAAHADNPPKEVLPHLQNLVRSAPPDPILYAALGRCYVQLGMPDLALGWYTRALNQNAQNEEAAIGLLACYDALGQHDKLYKQYELYLAQWQDNTSIHEDFIAFLQHTEQWAAAADKLEILSSITRQNRTPDIALARRKAGQYAQAAILYRNMLRKKPKERILLHNLVYCLDKMGQSAAALNLLKIARDTLGEHTETMLIEGILLLRAKRTDDAIRILQYIAEKYPADARIRGFLNKALKRDV